jgi:hypothetical protein
MKCPSVCCGGKMEQTVNSSGGGSEYCLEGCGYYKEFPNGTFPAPRREYVENSPRRIPRKKLRSA